MKKSIFIVVSLLTAMPCLHAQDEMQDEAGVTKQQLEQFLTEKPSEQVEAADVAASENQDVPKAETVQDAADSSAETVAGEEKPVEESAAEEKKVTEPEATEISMKEETIAQDVVETSSTQAATAEESQATPAEVIEKPQEIEVPSTPVPFGPETSTENAAVQTQEEKPHQPLAQPTVTEENEPASETVKSASVAAPEEQSQTSLLDTIDIEEGGNWVLKRKALQDTVRKIEDINALYDDIRDTNIVFLQGINTVDVLFTQFSYDVGLDLGKVDQLVQDVSHHLESERAEGGDLSEAEREILQRTQERKKEIDQLHADIQDIWHAHAQLKEARTLNDEQIIEADRIRKQAWRNFRMIERVLNEVRAEELYNETAQLFAAMQTNYRYLQTRLIPYFEQSIKTIQEKMQMVKNQAEDLQAQGVLLKQEAIKVDQMEREKELQEEVVTPAQSNGWFGTVKNIIMAPVHAVGSLWDWVTGSSTNEMSKYLPDEESAISHETQHPEEL